MSPAALQDVEVRAEEAPGKETEGQPEAWEKAQMRRDASPALPTSHPLGEGGIIIPTSQRRRLRLREATEPRSPYQAVAGKAQASPALPTPCSFSEEQPAELLLIQLRGKPNNFRQALKPRLLLNKELTLWLQAGSFIKVARPLV